MSHSIRRIAASAQPLAAAEATAGARLRRAVTALSAAAMLSASALVIAQTPAKETPRPQDLEPGVNTSAPSQAPSREAPRPQDLDPAVNTSAVPANGAGDATSSLPAGVPQSTLPSRPASAAPPSRPTESAAAAASRSAAGAASATRSTTGTASPSTTATPNTPGSKPRGKSLDRLELDTTQITGNRELPKVLYIVPWKRADLGDLVGKPVNSLLDEVLAPVDRDVFKRENRYYRALTPPEGQPAGAEGAPAASSAGATSSGSATPAAKDER